MPPPPPPPPPKKNKKSLGPLLNLVQALSSSFVMGAQLANIIGILYVGLPPVRPGFDSWQGSDPCAINEKSLLSPRIFNKPVTLRTSANPIRIAYRNVWRFVWKK